MKKAVITTGGHQYLVGEGDVLEVEKLTEAKPTFEPLMVIGDNGVKVGKPNVDGAKVSAEVLQAEILGDKVLAIRYKPKKRVRKVRGHRQRLSQIKITKIA